MLGHDIAVGVVEGRVIFLLYLVTVQHVLFKTVSIIRPLVFETSRCDAVPVLIVTSFTVTIYSVLQ